MNANPSLVHMRFTKMRSAYIFGDLQSLMQEVCMRIDAYVNFPILAI